jgi:hypothetical protein
MLPNQLDKLATVFFIRMIQPAASINNVILLNDPYSRPVGRCVREYKNAPPLFGRLRFEQLFKPTNLFVVNNNFV